jgi:glycosyltransferase involved in cell wall biosynthesis
MLGQFKIVVPSFNSVKYLPKTLGSIEKQKMEDFSFDVCVVDDASTLPEQRKIISEFCQRNGWKFLFQNVNQGQLVSIMSGIQELNCQDEDVIIYIDGDDWLIDDQVLITLADVYRSSHVYVTYGSYETHPKDCINITYAAPITKEMIQNQRYRELPWVFQHLHTFKYHLWKRIKDEDLRDQTGEYYRVTGDRAFFYPLLEMAGSHIRFIERILYVYNLENPLNDHKISRNEQWLTELRIKSRPKYPILNEVR